VGVLVRRGLAAVVLSALALVGGAPGGGGRPAWAATAERTYQVTQKFWKATVAGVNTLAVTNLPSDLIAYEGDTVVIVVRNESPIAEGFSIDAYGVHGVLASKQTRTFRLSGLRAGAYVIYCQLHPYSVHYPGTLLVLPRR